MGGYTHGRPHVTVEACVRVDAAMLRRAGLLAEDGARLWSYSSRVRHTCDVIAVSRLAEPAIALMIAREGERHTQRVHVEWQPCRYGGRRAWLRCPLCARRVFRLFYYDNTYNNGARVHFFACRHCYDLTYELRRERDKYWWHVKRQSKIKKRLGGSGDYSEDLPDKPKWMRWHTYSRLAREYWARSEQADESFMLSMARKFPNLLSSK